MARFMVEVIHAVGALSTNQLREAIKRQGGKTLQSAAMDLLEAEDPPRVVAREEMWGAGRGKHPGCGDPPGGGCCR
jgi:hypothetical protein